MTRQGVTIAMPTSHSVEGRCDGRWLDWKFEVPSLKEHMLHSYFVVRAEALHRHIHTESRKHPVRSIKNVLIYVGASYQ